MLDLDVSKALLSKADLELLVDAVAGAEAVDEWEWIEWKASLDLDKPAGQFAVARAVLGMANRVPEAAAAFCGGHGYFLVGVEPGAVTGVPALDSADWTPGVDLYAGGAAGPRWTPQWLRIDEKYVLVVIVDPPRWGDGPWRLLRNHGGTEPAAPNEVFVRRGAKTSPATPTERSLLDDRGRRTVRNVVLEISRVDYGALAWFDDDEVADRLRAATMLVYQRELDAAHAAVEAGREPDRYDMARLRIPAMDALVGRGEDRKLEQYESELNLFEPGTFLTVRRGDVPDGWLHTVASAGSAAWFPGAEVVACVVGFDGADEVAVG